MEVNHTVLLRDMFTFLTYLAFKVFLLIFFVCFSRQQFLCVTVLVIPELALVEQADHKLTEISLPLHLCVGIKGIWQYQLASF